MRTPSGRECDYYYEDCYRGRDLRECRISRGAHVRRWHPHDCEACEVPEILAANSSEDLELVLTQRATWLGLGNRTVLEAWCARHMVPVDDPRRGCPECAKEMPLPDPEE